MSANRYSNILTIVLVVLIIGILVGVGFLFYKFVIDKNNDNQKIEAIEEFDRTVSEKNKDKDKEKENNEEEEQLEVKSADSSNNGQGSGAVRQKTYYKGFAMLGYIKIAKTNVNEPILDEVTPETLDTAVAVLYPSNAQLNEPGNVVIIGHNYKNGKFFSNNKKLSVGDTLQIKDNSGRELTYTIYEKFETSETDTSFYNRDTNGAVEVTLSTCTDDVKARTIIKARVE